MQNINLKFKEKNINLFLRDEVDVSVMREIFKVREYKKIEEIIKNAKYPILDVGAHAGFFSLYVRALNPTVKIFAIEPEKENLKMLKKNLEANGIEYITNTPLTPLKRGKDSSTSVGMTTVIEGAIAKNTEKRILEVTPDNQNHFLKETSTTSRSSENDNWVQAYSLSDFCKENNIKNFL